MELLYNFIGLRSTINKEWWYIRFYITVLLLFPILDITVTYFMERCGRKKFVCLFLGVIAVASFFPKFRWMILDGSYFVFAVGYLCAKLEILDNISPNRNTRCLAVLLILGIFISKIFIVEVYLGTDYHKLLDFLFVPIFIWGVIQWYDLIPKGIVRLLELFGKYSTYIWLTHTFFCYYYWQTLVVWPRYSILVFVWLILICLGVSSILDKALSTLHFKHAG